MNNEQQLVDAGYVLTPQVFHSGKGDGKVYEKSFDNVAPFDEKNVEGGKHYDYYSVDPAGVVAEFELAVSPAVETPVEPVTPAQPAEVPVEPKVETQPTE